MNAHASQRSFRRTFCLVLAAHLAAAAIVALQSRRVASSSLNEPAGGVMEWIAAPLKNPPEESPPVVDATPQPRVPAVSEGIVAVPAASDAAKPPKPAIDPRPTSRTTAKSLWPATSKSAPIRRSAAKPEKPAERPRPKTPQPAEMAAPETASPASGPPAAATVPAAAATDRENGGGAESDAVSAYHEKLQRLFESRWRQPEGIKTGAEGAPTARIALTISADGSVTNRRLVQSSGHGAVDTSAMAAAESVEKIDPLPRELGVDSYRVLIKFVLH